MTTDELIRAIRKRVDTNGCWNDGCWNKCKKLMTEAADRMEEQDRIIQRYKRADVFLATHGWEWRDDD